MSNSTTRETSDRIPKAATARQATKPQLWQRNLPIEDIKRMYIEDKLSYAQIASKFACSYGTIGRRLREAGVPIRLPYWRSGALSSQWKGGRHQQAQGYIEVHDPTYPKANRNGYVLEHIKIWEEIHHQSVPKGWVIHHLNGIRTDNRPCNLMAMPRGKHMSGHVRNYIRWAEVHSRRIRELEAENKQLRKALGERQMIFVVSDN